MLEISHSDFCSQKKYKVINYGKEIAKHLRLAACMVIEDVNGSIFVTK